MEGTFVSESLVNDSVIVYNKYTWKSNHIHTRITKAQCKELVRM